MPQSSTDNLIDAISKRTIKPIEGALNNVEKYVPDWLPGGGNSRSTSPTGWNPSPNKEQQNQIAKEKPKLASAPNPTPKPVPKFHKGTDYVPETGKADLKKGEAVLNKEDADKLREAKGKGMNTSSAVKSVVSELGGKSETPKKEIKHIITRKAHGGKGHIHTHVHTHPAHADEEHVTSNDDEMAEHMMQHLGTPNPGEAEADAGQSGIPAAAMAAAPQPGAAAPGAGPAGAVPIAA